MIGRHHAGLAVARDLRAIDKIHHRVRCAEVQHKTLPGAVAFAVRQAAGAADDRRDIREPRRPGRQFGADKSRLAIFRQPLLRKAHQRDHALIGLPCLGAEAEDAVLDEDQAFDRGIRIEHLRRGFGQTEARHDVGHIAHPRAKNLAA